MLHNYLVSLRETFTDRQSDLQYVIVAPNQELAESIATRLAEMMDNVVHVRGVELIDEVA